MDADVDRTLVLLRQRLAQLAPEARESFVRVVTGWLAPEASFGSTDSADRSSPAYKERVHIIRDVFQSLFPDAVSAAWIDWDKLSFFFLGLPELQPFWKAGGREIGPPLPPAGPGSPDVAPPVAPPTDLGLASLEAYKDTWVIGPYRVWRLVGNGSSASVHQAQLLSAEEGRFVGIRILNQKFREELAVKELREQAKRLRQVSETGHANILPFYHLMHANNQTLFVSEFAYGGSLRAAVNEAEGGAKLGVILRALRQILDALIFLHHHDRQIFSAALGPKKIVLSADKERILLTDCGLSAQLRKLRGDGTGDGAGKARNLRELGDLVYELLYSSPPAELLSRLPKTPFHLPAWFQKLLLKLLTSNPSQAFTEAADVLRELESYLEPRRAGHLIVSAHPEPEKVRYGVSEDGYVNAREFSGNADENLRLSICQHWEDLWDLDQSRISQATTIKALHEATSAHGASLILGPPLQAELSNGGTSAIWLVPDRELTPLPFEIFDDLALRRPVSRSLRSEHPHRRRRELSNGRIRVVLVEDPSGQLPAARKERACLKKVCHANPLLEVVVADKNDDAFTVSRKIASADILHLMVHSDEDEFNLGCYRMRSTALAGHWPKGAPFLVFANSCRSARVPAERSTWRQTLNMAEAFLQEGVTNYIGAIPEIDDNQTSVQFALAFYREFLTGHSTVSQSMLEARRQSAEQWGKARLVWARYVLYGDPFTSLGEMLGAKTAAAGQGF